MTLLTICENAANDIGIESSTAIVNSTNDTAKMLLAQARREVRVLMRRHNWAALIREETFTAAIADDEIDLPAGFDRMLSDTVWSRTDYWQMRGPMTAQEWQLYKSGITAATPRQRWRLLYDKTGQTKNFRIDPTPAAATDMVFEYVTDLCVIDTSGTAKTTWTADYDVSLLDETLIELGVVWRTMNRLGLAYLEEKNEYERQVALAVARDYAPGALSLNGDGRMFLGSNIPETGTSAAS